MRCSVQLLFKPAEMSLAAPDCFWQCVGSGFQECSWPRINSCERCRQYCVESDTGSSQKRRKCLSLKGKENSTRISVFLLKEDEMDLQKAFVPSNTKRSTDWAREQHPHFSFLSKENEMDLQKAFVPSNTKQSSDWAGKVFFDWRKARGAAGEDECPGDLLERGDPGDLVKWLSLFMAEARTVKGSHYSPSILSQLMAGILRHLRSVNPASPNFLDKHNCNFKLLHSSCPRFGLLRAVNNIVEAP